MSVSIDDEALQFTRESEKLSDTGAQRKSDRMTYVDSHSCIVYFYKDYPIHPLEASHYFAMVEIHLIMQS